MDQQIIATLKWALPYSLAAAGFVALLCSNPLRVEQRGIVKSKFIFDMCVDDCNENKSCYGPPLILATPAISVIDSAGQEIEYLISRQLCKDILEGQNIRFMYEKFFSERTIVEIIPDTDDRLLQMHTNAA